MDWDNVWGGLLAATVAAGVVALGITLFAPKEITYYYGGTANQGVCVYSHWTWHVDEKVFCPQNQAEIPEFVKQFNATLPMRSDLQASQLQEMRGRVEDLEKFANKVDTFLRGMSIQHNQ